MLAMAKRGRGGTEFELEARRWEEGESAAAPAEGHVRSSCTTPSDLVRAAGRFSLLSLCQSLFSLSPPVLAQMQAG